MPKGRKYSIEDLDGFIKSIKSGLKLKEEEIAVRLGYNEGYISQTRARGFVPDKFMEALKREFAKSNENGSVRQIDAQHGDNSQKQGFNLIKEVTRLRDEQITIEATLSVILSEIAPLIAKATGRSHANVFSQMKKDVLTEIANLKSLDKKLF